MLTSSRYKTIFDSSLSTLFTSDDWLRSSSKLSATCPVSKEISIMAIPLISELNHLHHNGHQHLSHNGHQHLSHNGHQHLSAQQIMLTEWLTACFPARTYLFHKIIQIFCHWREPVSCIIDKIHNNTNEAFLKYYWYTEKSTKIMLK